MRFILYYTNRCLGVSGGVHVDPLHDIFHLTSNFTPNLSNLCDAFIIGSRDVLLSFVVRTMSYDPEAHNFYEMPRPKSSWTVLVRCLSLGDRTASELEWNILHAADMDDMAE